MRCGGMWAVRAPARPPWCLVGSLGLEISASPFPSLHLSRGFTHPFAWPFSPLSIISAINTPLTPTISSLPRPPRPG